MRTDHLTPDHVRLRRHDPKPAAAPARHGSLEDLLPQLGWLAGRLAGPLPDFLIISPPKTGSTWLAANLGCHPEVFVPAAKELKYFSSYHRWLDVSWYTEQFRAGAGRVKGEASPSYSLLPRRMIRLLRALMPRVKLVFLMRDPVGRAWSHARHNYRFREANFLGFTDALDAIPDEKWRENFRHPWPLLSGDYLGQLRRWLSVFPPEQILVDCYERIRTDPVGVLSRVFRFLGVSTDVDWASFRTRETILRGVDKPLPDYLKQELQLLLRERTCRLAEFLRAQFEMPVHGAWGETLGSAAGEAVEQGATDAGDSLPDYAASVFERGDDDDYLDALLGTEMDSPQPQLIEEGYQGYNLVLHRGRFLALWQGLGEMNLAKLDEAAAGGRTVPDVLVATSLPQVRELVRQQVLLGLRQTVTALETRLDTWERGRHLRHRELAAQLQALSARVAEAEAFVAQVRGSLLYRVRRVVRGWFRRGTAPRRQSA